jgi:hypothetical protein
MVAFMQTSMWQQRAKVFVERHQAGLGAAGTIQQMIDSALYAWRRSFECGRHESGLHDLAQTCMVGPVQE